MVPSQPGGSFADESEAHAIRQTLLGTPGVIGVHDLRTRKMDDMIVVDVHIEVDATISAQAGHHIAIVRASAS
ncbi:hypothetical protein PPGU19_098520 (plasmid) [Paraburkholderia sp. PGU19]|nr:hypothetical protein PPGU19_098520 [Paraburkholderia sp. PGU19]